MFLHYLFADVLYKDLIKFAYEVHNYDFWSLVFNRGTYVFYSIYLVAILNFFFGEALHPVPKEWHNII